MSAIYKMCVVNLETLVKYQNYERWKKSRWVEVSPKSIKCSICNVRITHKLLPFMIFLNKANRIASRNFKVCSHCFQTYNTVLTNEINNLPIEVQEKHVNNRFISMLDK